MCPAHAAADDLAPIEAIFETDGPFKNTAVKCARSYFYVQEDLLARSSTSDPRSTLEARVAYRAARVACSILLDPAQNPREKLYYMELEEKLRKFYRSRNTILAPNTRREAMALVYAYLSRKEAVSS